MRPPISRGRENRPKISPLRRRRGGREAADPQHRRKKRSAANVPGNREREADEGLTVDAAAWTVD